jgi:hypothetical protein
MALIHPLGQEDVKFFVWAEVDSIKNADFEELWILRDKIN